MTMHDWVRKLDEFLKASGRKLFEHAGTISAEVATAKAEREYERYPQHFAMLALGLATGRRPSGLRPMRRNGPTPDILWGEGVLLVRRSEAKGQVMETTKTGKRLCIPLPTELMDILRWHVDNLPEGPRIFLIRLSWSRPPNSTTRAISAAFRSMTVGTLVAAPRAHRLQSTGGSRMRLATALSLTLALGLSLSACSTRSKDEGTPDAASGGMGGQASGSGSRSSASPERADAAVKGTGGSVAPDAGLATKGSAGQGGGLATGTGGSSVQGGAGGSASTGAGDDGGVASGGSGGSPIQGGAGDAGVAAAGGTPGPGGAGGSSSSSGQSGGCDCVQTEFSCLCRSQSYYCKPNVSDFTSGAVMYNTLVEYADCNVSVVETGGSSGREILIYDRSSGSLVGRRHYSDIDEPCSSSRVISVGLWPAASCRKTKCVEGPWANGACGWMPDRWDGRSL